MEYVRDNVSEA